MAKPNPLQIIINTGNDFNPPLYYLLLHFWIIIAGHRDEALRLMSFVFHILTAYTAFKFSEKVFSRRFAYFVLCFTLFNPMLVYYAFELRMYSQYAFLSIASLYFIYFKNWKWYTISVVLGLYTHSFFPLIIASYTIFYWITKQLNKKNFILIFKPILFYLPWLPVIIIQFFRSYNSWLFPVDLQLVKSVLGNLFTNYEGTPGGLWKYTFFLSLFIFYFLYLGLKRFPKKSLIFLIPIFIPLALILSYSSIKQPLYVNRYLIFVTIFEIMGISLGIWSIKSKLTRSIYAVLWFMLVVYINLFLPQYLKKTDFKSTFFEVNRISTRSDSVFAKTPIGFLESAYYNKFPDKTFIFNPNNIKIPNYIGATLVFPNSSKSSLPPPPSRTFLINDDASYEVIINN
ncbi:glycosyltransferase family 39 protein [Candidatus Gottesmanbacteria bacterium]|nr:glycosyltransferase family 39 protein [Candidatus Gottesmanbacteria bacterium]